MILFDKKNSIFYYVFAALCLHVFILCPLLFYFHFKENNLGKETIAYTRVYLSLLDQKHRETVGPTQNKNQATPETITKKTDPIKDKKIPVKKEISSFNNPLQTMTDNQSRTGLSDQLLERIHRAIQKQQRYPFTAQLKNQTGIATIAFELAPTGDITHIRLTHSSGYDLLDTAALNAVKQAAPIQHIETLLKKPQSFQIPVAFELTMG